jgi:hypothetical protein
VSLLEPISEEDAIEARFLTKMKDEADLEIRRREGFFCRPVSVRPFISVSSSCTSLGHQGQRCQRRSQLAAFPGIP